MQEQFANITQFLFTTEAVDADTFQVSSYKGVEAISETYSFEIELRSDKDAIPLNDIAGSNATLYIYRDEQYIPYSGIISKFMYIDKSTDWTYYRAILVPRLWVLNLTIRSKVYQKKSVTDVIKEILDESGIVKYELKCGNYPQREFIMQYNESNFDFVNRLMEDAGIWYFFTEQPVSNSEISSTSTETMVITDQASNFQMIESPSEIKYRSQSGLAEYNDLNYEESISKVSLERKLIPSEVTLKTYNYRTPEIDISDTRPVKKGFSGAVAQFGGTSKNVTDLISETAIARDRFASSHSHIDGKGTCRGLRAGTKFELIDTPLWELEDVYLIMSATHEGQQNITQSYDTNSQQTYSNRFSALPSEFTGSYRPPVKTPKPVVSGIATAQIEANGSDYAYIDEVGRYKIRLPFDEAENSDSQASKFVRLSQPYSGTNYGFHFPSHEHTEMIVGFVNGDPDKVIGLGTIPNGNTISPVTNANKHQSVIRTAGNNEIVLDDLDGKQKVSIRTNAKNNQLFDDENRKIEIQTTDDNKIILDDKNKMVIINAAENTITLSYEDSGSRISIVTAKKHVITLDDQHKCIVMETTGGHQINMDDQRKCIEMKTTGGHQVIMDDLSQVITLTHDKGENTVTLDRTKGIVIDTRYDVIVNADGDIKFTAANITMQASEKINTQSNNDISIQGKNVGIEAAEKASINGKTEFEANGGITNIEGKGAVSVKAGATLSLEGSLVKMN